jgi:hypothetical protein
MKKPDATELTSPTQESDKERRRRVARMRIKTHLRAGVINEYDA